MDDHPDLTNFSRDELVEEYCKLFDKYQDFRESNESDKQKIYDLQRSLQTATSVQAYLSGELEQYTNSDNNKVEEELNRAQEELLDVNKKYLNLKTSFSSLQQDYSLLLEENSKLSQNLKESLKLKEKLPIKDDTKICNEYLLHIQELENENMDLLQKIEDFEERSMRYTLTIAECEKNIELLRDQIMCLEENLQSKRVDLEENAQILESTQEQLVKANMEIAMLSGAPNNKDRKGNSLFAEVDDQRQAMKQLLKSQKQCYLQMKIKYDESEHEIRRLKRENIAMRTELEACSTIFCNADKIYQEKLNERIRHLLNQNENLERKLKWTEEKLKELADEKGVLFLDSMLNFCKKETDDLKSQLHCVRIQKASLEEQLRKSQQDMARWRFESLKSRCILIDREHLLTENKIAFKPVHAVEFNISEKDQVEAKPRIVSNRRSNTFENVIDRKTITPSKVTIKQESATPVQNAIQDNSLSNTPNFKKKLEIKTYIDPTDTTIKTEEKMSEKQSSYTKMPEMSGEEINSMIVDTSKRNESFNMLKNEQCNNNENKEKEYSITNFSIDDIPALDNLAKSPTPIRTSQKFVINPALKISDGPPASTILTKEIDLKDSSKNKKLPSDGDIKIQGVAYQEMNSMIIDKTKLNEILNMSKNKQPNNNEDKENDANNSIDEMSTLDNLAKPPTPMRPSQKLVKNPTLKTSAPTARSILTKEKDLRFHDFSKSVKFSSNADIIHNISQDALSPISTTANVEVEADLTINKVGSKSSVQKSHTKSNIVVRRFVVSSKHK